MSTLADRPNTALLVVDVQNGVVAGAHERDSVVANVAGLVEKARREQVPVVWVQHADEQLAPGSEDWRIVPELAPAEAEPLVAKHYGDSFEDTGLESVLEGLGVGRLVVVGAQTDACVRSTLHGAFVRGLRRDPRRRRAHHRGQHGVGRAPAGAGDRAHEPVLGRAGGSRTDGRHGRDPRRRLRGLVPRAGRRRGRRRPPASRPPRAATPRASRRARTPWRRRRSARTRRAAR